MFSAHEYTLLTRCASCSRLPSCPVAKREMSLLPHPGSHTRVLGPIPDTPRNPTIGCEDRRSKYMCMTSQCAQRDHERLARQRRLCTQRSTPADLRMQLELERILIEQVRVPVAMRYRHMEFQNKALVRVRLRVLLSMQQLQRWRRVRLLVDDRRMRKRRRPRLSTHTSLPRRQRETSCTDRHQCQPPQQECDAWLRRTARKARRLVPASSGTISRLDETSPLASVKPMMRYSDRQIRASMHCRKFPNSPRAESLMKQATLATERELELSSEESIHHEVSVCMLFKMHASDAPPRVYRPPRLMGLRSIGTICLA